MLNFDSVEAYIPPQFRDGRPIEHIILVCDVDGVIRYSTEADIDSQVLLSIKDLISTQNVDVSFISGTPVSQSPFLETWRCGNITLDRAIGSFFMREIQDKKVTIYGAFGGQQMNNKCEVEIIDEYPFEIAFELGKLLLYAFLEEVKNKGTYQQKNYAENLKTHLDRIKLKNKQQASTVTADEFREIVSDIHCQLDPNFRLISYGSFVESQTSNPPWDTDWSLKWIQNQLDCPSLLISQISKEQKQVATGLAHRENKSFNFLIISKINKSVTIKKHLQEKLLLYPDALIVTIGDTQVDFPMHKHAHLAYHVGKEQVWKNHLLPQCMLVRDSFGCDSQHVNGTLYVLNILKNGIGKPISQWNLSENLQYAKHYLNV